MIKKLEVIFIPTICIAIIGFFIIKYFLFKIEEEKNTEIILKAIEEVVVSEINETQNK